MVAIARGINLFYFICLIFCVTVHANINNLKGTFDILKDEYKEFSVINGAIATNTDYIMHLYDYGTLGQIRKVTMPDQTVVEVPDISNAPELVKLVHLCFHRVPGTISRCDFVLREDLRKANDRVKISTIQGLAWILAQVKQLEKQIATSKKTANPVLQKLRAISLKDISVKSELANLEYLATETSHDINKILAEKPDALKLFKLIWQSFEQERGAKAIFPLYATTSVILGVVYKLTDANKKLIQLFYEKLNEILMSSKKEEAPAVSTIFVDNSQIPQNWVNEQFNPAEHDILGASLTFDATNFEQLKQHYETIIYLTLFPLGYPQPAGYITATYHYDLNDMNKTVDFSDCMETLIRNLCNLLLYNQDNVTFDLTKLSNVQPIQSFINFYETNRTAVDTESKHLHDQWTPIIENIPFAAYKQKVGGEEKATDLAKQGYIKIPEGMDIGNEYIKVGQDAILYEVRASLKNIIIVLNHILQLDLFHDEVGNTSEEKIATAFVRNDFIKTYFPLLCNKLGIRFRGFFEGYSDVTDTIDTLDYGPIITTALRIGATDIELVTKKGHGLIKIVRQSPASNAISRWFDMNIDRIADPAQKFFDTYFYSLPYLAYMIQSRLHEHLIKIDAIHIFNLLFYLPIGDADKVKTVIELLINSRAQLNDPAIHLLLFLSRNIPDENQKNLTNILVDQIIVRNNKWNPKKGLSDIKGSSAKELGKKAAVALNSSVAGIIRPALDLFMALFEKQEGFEEAINAASALIKSNAIEHHIAALHLYIELLKHGQDSVIQQAIEAASFGIKSQNKNVQSLALELFKILLGKEKGAEAYTAALADANVDMQSPDLNKQSQSLTFFKLLLNENLGYQEAISAASLALKSENVEIQGTGIQLFEELFAIELGYDEAANGASTMIQSDNYNTQEMAKKLFAELFEKGHGYDQAQKTALTIMKSKDQDKQYAALYLCELLVKKGLAYKTAINAVIEAATPYEYALNRAAANLFDNVLERLSAIKQEQLTPTLKKTIEYAIQAGKAVKTFDAQGKRINEAALAFEQKMQMK